ncbi:MAG: family 16 glycosylhydrolase [Luteolibacter sp.]
MTISTFLHLFAASLLFQGTTGIALSQEANPHPFSDQENAGGWVLNKDISDEFAGTELDTEKWWAQGDGGYYKWKGRAPSQFVKENVVVEDGKLKIRSKWEPDYDFSKDKFDGRNYENITTAGVVGHKRFLYGYMEAKTKAADSGMTSAFWTLGYQSELDMYEQLGRPVLPHKKGFESSYMFSIHDWRPGIVPGQNKSFTHTHKLPYRVADDFHVYGCEWGEDYVKFYADGKLVHSATQKEMGDSWILDNPLEIWFDSEVFYWFGIPAKEDFPCDYEIEYFRLWQKPHPNLLDRAFFGFEGPLLKGGKHLPANPEKDAGEWYFPKEKGDHFSINKDHSAIGRKSLKFASEGKIAGDSVAFAPYGSVNLPAGEYTLSMKVWVSQTTTVKKIHPILEEPWVELAPIDLTAFTTRGQWVTVKQTFSRKEPSTEKDRLRLVIKTIDVADGSSKIYIDDINISKN